MSEPLRVSVTPWRGAADGNAARLCEQAEFAEALGFDGFFLPENHFSGDGAIPEPMMLLAAVAARTSKIRLGTSSYLLPVRHPLQAAEQVAVLDRLSGGRVILGLGRGYQKAMFAAFDVDTREKRNLFAGALDVMRRAWAGEAVAGGLPLAPLPVQRPHPPLWVAAFGPKAIAQAGRLGLPYLVSPVEPLPVIEANLARHRESLADAGHEAPLEVPIMRTVFVSTEPRVLEDVRARLAAQAAEMARNSTLSAVSAASRTGIDDWAIVGTPDEVRAGIERYRRLGMNRLVATRLRLAELPEALCRESLRLLAEVARDAR